MPIGYIYKTTNLINGKIYIGQHQRKIKDENYFGSGDLIQRAIKKYGKCNFSLEVLYWAKTLKRLNEAEIYFIKAFDATNIKIGYNIAFGGYAIMKGRKHTKESKQKNREKHIGKKASEETKNKIRLSLIGKNVGKIHSYETRKKNSDWHKGKPVWNKGIPMTQEMKDRISKTKTGKKQTEQTVEKRRKSLIGKKHNMSESWIKKNKELGLSKRGLKWSEARRLAQNNRGKI